MKKWLIPSLSMNLHASLLLDLQRLYFLTRLYSACSKHNIYLSSGNSSHLALWAPPNKGGTYITLAEHWPCQRGRGCTVRDTLALVPNPRCVGESHFLCYSLIKFWKSTETSAMLFWINRCVKTNKEFTLSLATFNGKISHMDNKSSWITMS